MFKYKREINNYEQARQIEYSLTDNSKICFCTTGTLYTKALSWNVYKKWKSFVRKYCRNF